jgi:hypothetical protein
MRQPFPPFRNLLSTRLVVGLMTAWFFVVISGLPLPELREAVQDSSLATNQNSHSSHKRQKDLSQPFPCMFSRCGCNNAEQCWRQCCCHDLRSKLAWARQNNVTPPDYVIAEARAKGLLGPDESIAECDTEKRKSKCCEKSTCEKTATHPSCCEHSDCEEHKSHKAETETAHIAKVQCETGKNCCEIETKHCESDKKSCCCC